MIEHNPSDGAEVYVIYADLFLMLFMMAILMIGSNASSNNLSEAKPGSGKPDSVLNLYIDASGHVFADKARRRQMVAHDIGEKIVVLYTPKNLPMAVFQRVQRRVKETGVVSVRYIVDENYE